jgi:aminoglycoside phosphotransferase (APT) family kinase protein
VSPATVEVAASSPEITRALRDAFGDEPVEDLAVMTGGRSGATLLSLTVGGKGYVLRRRDPARPGNELRTAREIECMRIASERGVAPRLRHVDAASGVTIMERVEVAPCARRTGCVASTLRRLHEGPAFPTGRATSVTAMAHFADGVLRARGDDGLPEDLLRTMDELATATKRHAETAPCHNDLNPGNILTTRDAAVFIDWEISGQGDPFFDLGQLGVFMFRTPGARAELLEAYLGRRPSEEEQARAFVARVMALGFFAASFFHHVMGGKGRAPATPVSMPDLLGLLGSNRAFPEVVAVSLLEEMRQEKEKLTRPAPSRGRP